MPERRESPYVWVTWVARLLAGEAHCEWAAWFRAHHMHYEKRPNNFDLASWNAAHSEMIRERAEALRQAGFVVTLDEQNKFTLKGDTGAALGGKPDILATKDAEALVIDCKTGRQRHSDYFQVLVYMLALPFVNARCRGKSLAGEIQYSDRSVSIQAAELNTETKERIWRILKRVTAEAPPPRVPSFAECSFCDITATDCPERVDHPPVDEQEKPAPF